MSRRPEIGNIQLYPSRPLGKADKNGFVLKFFCPIRRTRIRRNCGTRDRREARRILRECRTRLLNGEYIKSGGAISELHDPMCHPTLPVNVFPADVASIVEPIDRGMTWDECYEKYRTHKTKRTSKKQSFNHARSRLEIAKKIFQSSVDGKSAPIELMVKEVMTLSKLEHLQEQLLEGAESRYGTRSPNTVNSMIGAVMAFVRFCGKRGFIDQVPDVEPLDVDGVMKGRPISGEEFDRMLDATDKVVGKSEAESWKFALRVLWFSGFRVGDLMDFHWTDARHICPIWASTKGTHPTISIPSSQKNGKVQEVPMLPELEGILNSIPTSKRNGWIVNPMSNGAVIREGSDWFQPCDSDLRELAGTYNNLSIAKMCGVTEATIRNWLKQIGFSRVSKFKTAECPIPDQVVTNARTRAIRSKGETRKPRSNRLAKDHVSGVISAIGEKAGVIVRQKDERTGTREKFASAHDIRRGCAQRLINAGVSAETLKTIMRHADFATTEKFYGASRSAQAAANEVRKKTSPVTQKSELVGGLMGGHEKTPQLDSEELLKLKSLLARL